MLDIAVETCAADDDFLDVSTEGLGQAVLDFAEQAFVDKRNHEHEFHQRLFKHREDTCAYDFLDDKRHGDDIAWLDFRECLHDYAWGYYKNPEATEDCMDADGWLSTGDICNLDHDGYLYIRGRDKNMILGPSGQNIYPEEIEDKLNNLPYVAESLIIDSGEGRLVALIYPDIESLTSQGMSEEAINGLMEENIKTLNSNLPAYSQVQRFNLMNEEFEKTPKRSIKRYLYQPK